jgi:NADH-quinone oxidoreductase subunit A
MEYGAILIFLIVGLLISSGLLMISYFVVSQKVEVEMRSPYECGFQPFQDARQEFDVRFYLVAILFLIFDLEIAYIFPWSVCLEGYWNMMGFLVVLTIGFIYEWREGVLDWKKSSLMEK